jgi:catalase
MFAYPDAARFRLGVNYTQLPANRPVCPVYCPYQRDGAGSRQTNYGSDPNYVRSSLHPLNFKTSVAVGRNGYSTGMERHDEWVRSSVEAYTSEVTDEDFEQAKAFWMILVKAGEGDLFTRVVAEHLSLVIPEIRERAIGEHHPADFRELMVLWLTGTAMFRRVHEDVATGIDSWLHTSV